MDTKNTGSLGGHLLAVDDAISFFAVECIIFILCIHSRDWLLFSLRVNRLDQRSLSALKTHLPCLIIVLPHHLRKMKEGASMNECKEREKAKKKKMKKESERGKLFSSTLNSLNRGMYFLKTLYARLS